MHERLGGSPGVERDLAGEQRRCVREEGRAMPLGERGRALDRAPRAIEEPDVAVRLAAVVLE
jgi:hypothetical protein